MEFLLILIILASWVFSTKVNGLVSPAGAMVLGFTAYSVPAVLGVYLSPSLGGVSFREVTPLVTGIVIWAWFWFFCGLLIFSNLNVFRKTSKYYAPVVLGLSMKDRRAGIFCSLCMIFSLLLFAWIAIVDSPLFFLEDRQVMGVKAEWQKMLWRWVNLYGLISAILIRSKLRIALFFVFIVTYFIAGDRTMILISGVSVAVYFFQNDKRVLQLVRPDLVIGVMLVVLLLALGKPIYISIKTSSMTAFNYVLNPAANTILSSYFEPLITHTLLEDIVSREFSYDWVVMLKTLFGQLLVIPSLFGIDSSAFNSEVQGTLYPGVSYGLASNYLAQAWSLGRWAGVAMMMQVLVLLISVITELSNRASPLPRIVFTIMGAVAGAYFYRNSLENVLSLLRQIAIVGIPLILGTQIVSSFRSRTVHQKTYGGLE